MSKALLFGGSFDPIHHGHLIVSRFVAEALGVQRVILVPSADPPHKASERISPARERLAMCELAVVGDPGFEVSDWEIANPGPSYTIRTVEHYRATLGGGVQVYWLVGLDSLRELATWHRARELVDLCQIVTALRPGFARPDTSWFGDAFSEPQIARLLEHIIPTPQIDIAATDLRARVRQGRSIRHLVPEAVRLYIEARGLYREA